VGLIVPALILAAAALATSLLLGDLQLALVSAMAIATALYAMYVDHRARRVSLHVVANALALAALEATRPALGSLDGVVAVAVFAYTVYVAYITYSYAIPEVWRIWKKYWFRDMQ
jgi:hypothetical protein